MSLEQQIQQADDVLGAAAARRHRHRLRHQADARDPHRAPQRSHAEG